MQRPNVAAGKLLCYPMAGPVDRQFHTLVEILQALDTDEAASTDLVMWIRRSYRLSHSFARKLYLAILRGMKLVAREGDNDHLTEIGKGVLNNRDSGHFYHLFMETYCGVDILLSILAEIQPATFDAIRDRWRDHMRSVRDEAGSWSAQHLASQLRFRIDWLRSLGLVDFVAGKYYLSTQGSQRRRATLLDDAPTETERAQISHNDLEDKLGIIGAFFQFDVHKRASVNQILPAHSHLKENRQVDCLWVRFVHFGGKVQYPFEVQLSGSMADAIERLEMVANVVQKAIVVTDTEQQANMMDRLRVKRSALLDKLVFLTPEEIEKVAEATVIMKSFTESLFQG